MLFTTDKSIPNGAIDRKFQFGYKGKRYPVPDLVALVNRHHIEPVEFRLDCNLVRKCEIGSMWGKCIFEADGVTVKDKIPLNPIMLAEHLDRIYNADTRFPIIVWKNRRILDGFHRVVKALYDRKESIMAYEVTEDILDELIKDKSE